MFDLLFILLFLATLIVLITCVVQVLRGRGSQAARLLKRHALILLIYFLVLSIVSWTSPQRVVPMQADRCFDDWCVAIEDATQAAELGGVKPSGVFYVVTIKLSNHARGRSQRAASAAIHLIDGNGTRYDVSPAGQSAFETQHGSIPPLTLMIEVGQSYETYAVFDLPTDAQNVGLTVEHPVGFSPGLFVIGDEGSLFHAPTIVLLP